MAVKEPVQDQQALLKFLQVAAGLSAAADTHKNVLFAGKKGREKYDATDFKNTESILENAVEGTDVMENLGMEPGKFTTWAAGNVYDVFNPVSLGISAATKAGKIVSPLAKFLSPIETATEEVGKTVVKKSLPKYLKQEMRHTKDFPHAERMAQEAIETGVSKKLSSPEKALSVLKGDKKRVRDGGTTDLPIFNELRTKGTMDEVGTKLQDVVNIESSSAPKINKARIFEEEFQKVKDRNKKGIEYQLDENSQEKILRDAISPTEMRKLSIPNHKKVPLKEAKSIDEDLDALEAILSSKKAERDAKYFTPADEPPPIPRMEPPPVKAAEYDDMGIEDLIATMSDKKNSKESLKSLEKLPDFEELNVEVESLSTLKELWDKKVALRKLFKDSTLGKKMSEWSDRDKALEGIIDNIDERIANGMSIGGGDAYAGLNQKYGAQAKLAQIFEDQLQQKSGGVLGNAARGGAEIFAGGGMNPGTIGRGTKGVMNAVTGPKRRVQFGNAMQDRRLTTPLSELLSEVTEIPFDTPYLEDKTERTEESDVDFSNVPTKEELDSVDFSGVPSMDEVNRTPQSVVEIPGAGDATDIMSPQPEQDPIHQKMDEVLQPQKPVWDPYINEEVLNTYLPRDSKRILANPQALLAKVQQVAPNQLPMIQELLDNDPEGMEEAGPKIAMMFPTLFEKDKYGMFDGKIVDPMMQQKFLKDLSDDEDMDSIAKAKMAMKVQRGESIHS